MSNPFAVQAEIQRKTIQYKRQLSELKEVYHQLVSENTKLEQENILLKKQLEEMRSLKGKRTSSKSTDD